ncbi:DUF1963 domain-containing protein [Rhizobium sp. C4]|uniref:DUF1963 domain-containing protein n=1 Tax=Rhizobium sp. C4 TaxID=1349800 RepID=UPI001E530EEC|nr:DUF1963 domain-containing protein [Rhizobium sp. C4]MCD2175653.1 DUF1963 domain-containing protein [Rhizobium sp. C4]
MKYKSYLLDVIVLARMKRDHEIKWQTATSWFGGLPAIDGTKWPRSPKGGFPLHHIAQIDLGNLPRGNTTPALPSRGILNFFIDTYLKDDEPSVGVVYSEDPSTTLAQPPEDCPPLYRDGWAYYYPGSSIAKDVPRVFRRWPIEFSLAQVRDGKYPDLGAAIDRAGPNPESIHLFEKDSLEGIESAQFPWQAVTRLVSDYKRVVNEHDANRSRRGPWPAETLQKLEEAWQKKEVEMPDVRAFIEHWDNISGTMDPFQALGEAAANDLETSMKALRPHIRYGGGTSKLRHAASDVYRDMMTDSAEVFARIPDEIRSFLINKRGRSGWRVLPHAMFGLVPTFQQSSEDFSAEIPLLSIQCDDMLSWMWGDVGFISVLISPDDLAARRWIGARGFFEGH